MRCLYPRTVGFKADGKTISWSQKSYSKEYATFQLPCSKCLECRLEYARQWAVRCVHEAKMYENNSFITLTYDDANLISPRLQYQDFQELIADLRDKLFRDKLTELFPFIPQEQQRQLWRQLPKNRRKELYEQIKIGFIVAGEYGDLKKRPHWHALIFNWRPTDCLYKYTNERGDILYTSSSLTNLWRRGISEIGSVTFESAGYISRYSTKKLVHGHDGTHDFNPIFKSSRRPGIGSTFLKKYWPDIFNYGHVILPTKDGPIRTAIPRYYEKWLSKNQPEAFVDYVTRLKSERMAKAEEKSKQTEINYWTSMSKRSKFKTPMITKSETRSQILKQKFNQLQKYLKGDI